MLTISVRKGFYVEKLDIKGAFIHAQLPKTDIIWVRLPKIPDEPIADSCLSGIFNYLYGLLQAPKLWYEHMSKVLSHAGFRRSHYSDFLFIGGANSNPVYIVAYVDNSLFIGAHLDVKSAKKKIG